MNVVGETSMVNIPQQQNFIDCGNCQKDCISSGCDLVFTQKDESKLRENLSAAENRPEVSYRKNVQSFTIKYQSMRTRLPLFVTVVVY
jgi:Ulp1 family protease